MDRLRLDIVYALRGWRRHPGPTAVAILALTLGIGANSTVFSFVSGVLLRPLPYTDPGRLVMMWQDQSASGGRAREVISPGLFIDWRTRPKTVTGVTVLRNWSPTLTGAGLDGNADAERLTGATVSGAFFTTLGTTPSLGRTFTDADDQPGAPPVAVIGDGLWHRRFGGQTSVIGQQVQLDGTSTEIIGVMPQGFRGAVIDAEIWNTIKIDAANAPRGIIMLRALGRLAPGVSLGQAQAEMDTLQAQLQREDDDLIGQRARLVPLQDDVVGPVRTPLLVLTAGVAMVLLIACANVTSILMARAAERRQELAVRVALGADRRRLMRQSLVESGMLALAGSLLGLVLAYFGVRVLRTMAPPQLPRIDEIGLDVSTLLFTATVTALAAFLAGLVPALSASRTRITSGLHEGARGDTRAMGRSRRLIVAAEVAAAMTLLVGAGLFVRTLVNLQNVDLGFVPDRLMTASLSPSRGSYGSPEAIRMLFDTTVERVSRLPGVESASITSVLPLSGMQLTFSFRIEGRARASNPRDQPVGSFRSVSTNYIETMGMRLLEGRTFSAEDRAAGPIVAIVNQTLVKKYWNGESPVGARFYLNGDEVTIVGVVADIHNAGPASVPDAEVYLPYVQFGARGGWLVVRTTGDPAAIVNALRQTMRDIDPNVPLALVRSMPSLVATWVAQPRFLASLLGGFSAVALVLAVLGVYGLLAFSVSQRLREIGVRMALGARPGAVAWLVLRESLAVVLAGAVVGAIGGGLLSSVARSLLFGIAPGDPVTIAYLMSGMVVVSLVASYLPARRAAGIDPVVALRVD
jgi:putative ABC transport system permease protein